ncbi:hypothetical protein L7F22_030765 [Adiantum nelumboides]|nr:hypothetical protein [Adiantum nelumboides]
MMDPASIKYTQTRFPCTFSSSLLKQASCDLRLKPETAPVSYSVALKTAKPHLSLTSLLCMLREGTITVDSIPFIRVFFHNDSWYSLDNRRLWVFKQYGAPIPVRVTTSLSDFLQKFQPDGDNQSATYRPDSNTSNHSSTVKDINNKDAGKQDLIDFLFQWSIDDIMTEDHLRSKASVIPESFTTLHQYFNSFKWPLVEEVRVQLKQSLENIYEAPYALIKEIREQRRPRPDEGTKRFTKLVLSCLEINDMHTKVAKARYKFKPNDFVLLCPKYPGSCAGKSSCYSKSTSLLAFITQVQEEELEEMQDSQSNPPHSIEYRILVKHPIEDTLCQELMETKKTWYVIYLMGLATPCRTWKALHPGDEDERNCSIIKATLDYVAAQDYLLEQDATQLDQELKAIIADYCSFLQLNISQADAIITSLCDIIAGGTPGVRMIQGPPGTGKTSTIVALLSVATGTRMKCLAVCPTNTAIATVALRFVELLLSQGKRQFGEFCKSAMAVDYKVLEKKDVILIGTEDKLPRQGLLQDVYLPNRVARIQLANRSWREAAVRLSKLIDLSGECQDPDLPSGELEKLLKVLEEHSSILAEDLANPQAGVFLKIAKLATECQKPDLELKISNKPIKVLLGLHAELQYCLKTLSWKLLSSEAVESLCLENCSVIFCTVSSAGRRCIKEAAPFKCLIIDEAAQLVEAETAIVTSLPGLSHAVLVGDHHQLPATVFSKTAIDCAYGRSLFERMISLGHPCHLLNTQYRMHPAISLFPSSNFYKGLLLDGDNVIGKERNAYEQLLYGPYAFIDVSDGSERRGDDGNSLKNLVEASVIAAIMRLLRKACLKRKTSSLTVGIITPYSSQRDYLIERFLNQKMEPLIVDVNSVDGFQGQEKDIIILSTVRANDSGVIGFLKDYRRLNVAITRARYCLWIVGCKKTLSARQNVWTRLLQDINQRGLLRRVADDDKLAKAVIKAKSDMGKYFDLLNMDSAFFSNMLWKVLFSNDFKNALMKIKSFERRQKILYKIRRLALGHHASKYKMTVEELKDLVEVHMVGDLCLIWSIDVERDLQVQQIIKIWDLKDVAKLPVYVKRLQNAFTVYSEGYIKRCKTRHLNWDKTQVQPATWEKNIDFVWLKPHEKNAEHQCSGKPNPITERSTVSESLLLMKFYAMSSGIAKYLVTGADGEEISLPFEVNEEESIIIKQPSSCFILGRSGTGKTTVLLTKLLQREQQWHISRNGLTSSVLLEGALGESNMAEGHIKQILVTLSPFLCSAIKRQLSQIQSTLSVGEPPMGTDSQYEVLLDSEDEDKMLGHLPDNFIDIPHKYYPLILTFRRFLKMLINSLPCAFPETLNWSSAKRCEVDYEQFDSEYWPHMDHNLTRKFDSCTVYTEITSIIKGSIQAVKSTKCCLSKEMYLSATRKGQHLSLDEKEAIYKLFIQYEKLKITRESCDLADNVQHVYKRLALGEYRGDKIDFVYIDEVQDFTAAQISLFSFLCSNPTEGYIFAGDTAQTIARGINFRFQEARSLFYTDFGIAPCMNAESAAKKGAREFTPAFFHLSHNFRTHIGVVNMANSIVQLLYYFFPQNIDKLDRETSLVWGQLPVILKADGHDLAKKIMEGSSDTNNQVHGLGAQQVILVRDEAQKSELIKNIGKQALVLTINSSKGLEFEDVLLYNFFTGSSLQNNWKVIYEYMHANNLMTSKELSKRSHPTFDTKKHSLLCSELKHMYVAVTRSRQRLWIYEENDQVSRPIIDYWMSQYLIETKLLDESFISQITSNSAPEEWKKRGLEVFNQKQYDMAILCFERAGDQYHTDLAKAASLRQFGEKQFSINRDIAIANLKTASEMFLALQRPESAAKCCVKYGDHCKAGIIYSKDCKPPRFEEGGDSFVEAKRWLEAASAYFEGKCVRKCLYACLQAKEFEKGLKFINQWTEQAPSSGFGKATTKEQCTDAEHMNAYLQECAEVFSHQHKMGPMMMFVNAFLDIELKRTFLREKGCLAELLSIEEAAENYLQAADLAELTGNFLRKAELLEKAGEFNNAVRSLLFQIQKHVFWDEQRKGWPIQTVEKPKDLLQRLQKLSALAEDSVRYEVELEIPLLFGEVQDLKDILAKALSSSSRKIRLFAAWKGIHDVTRFLGITQPKKGGKLDSIHSFQAKNAKLWSLVKLWIVWQDIILQCKEAILGNTQDKDTREFCYEFFCVTHCKVSQTVVVHNHEAYWFRGYKRGRLPIKISDKDFSDITARFWDKQVAEAAQSIVNAVSNYFASQRKSPTNFSTVARMSLLLDQAEATSMLATNIHFPKGILACVITVQREIYEILWPLLRQVKEMLYVQKLRKSTRVVAMLDKLANSCTGIKKRPHTLEETAKLQLMFPFLSDEWKSNNLNSLVQNIKFWQDVTLWPSNVLENDKLSVDDYVVKFGEQLLLIFQLDWRRVEDYIRPLTFVALLEKATIMACASDTLLHGMLIPLTMAVDFMSREGIDTRILKSQNVFHQKLSKLIERFAETALHLLGEKKEMPEWFQHVGANLEVELSVMVQRLFTLLLVICINSRESNLKARIIFNLKQSFETSNPLLWHLPNVFHQEIGRVLCAFYPRGIRLDEWMIGLQHSFAKVLLKMGDTLIMTTQCKNRCCYRRQEGIKTVDFEGSRSIVDQLHAIAGLNPLDISLDVSYTAAKTCSTLADHAETNVCQQQVEMEAARADNRTEKNICNDFLSKEAYSLKVAVDGSLRKTEDAMIKLETDDLFQLDELNTAKVELQQESCSYLDPSHGKHLECNTAVEHVQKTHDGLQKILKNGETGSVAADDELNETHNKGNCTKGSTANIGIDKPPIDTSSDESDAMEDHEKERGEGAVVHGDSQKITADSKHKRKKNRRKPRKRRN